MAPLVWLWCNPSLTLSILRFKCLGCGTMFLHSTNVRWHQQFCEQAQGVNGGYVVTQSDGEGLDTVPNIENHKSPGELMSYNCFVYLGFVYPLSFS